MPSVTEYNIARYGAQRVLLVARDRRLRTRLEHEFEHAGCEVVSHSHLPSRDSSRHSSFDVVLIDAAVYPGGSRPEVLGALRNGAPVARHVLLSTPDRRALAEQARSLGYQVLPRPARSDACHDVVCQALGRSAHDSDAVPVEMDFDFIPKPGALAHRHPAAAPLRAIPVERHLDFVLKQPEGLSQRRARSGVTALVVHALVLGIALMVPFLYTETLELRDMTSTTLIAPPPPPPPPPPPAQTTAQPRRVRPQLRSLANTLTAPAVIPRQVAEIVDPPDMEMDVAMNTFGVPGGVPGGQPGGVLGGVLGNLASVAPPPVALPPPKPLRVGGNVREPRLLKHVNPVYPPIARSARIEGQVRIDATIDANGRISNLKVLHGHPLLAKAAVDAVRQWVYEPTYLNNRPVPLLMILTVTFRLT